MQNRPTLLRQGGFSLVELAVVMAIVGLLLGGLMLTLSAQTEQRGFEDTRQRLERARELLLAYAIVNGRLPCPARCSDWPLCAASSGDEVRDNNFASPTFGHCIDGAGVADYYGGTLAGGIVGGLLPARTIGFQQVDASGYAIDAWGNRLRYAVSSGIPVNSQSPRICRPVNDTTPPVAPHFTHRDNLKANGIDCQPNDLLVCKSATGITPAACGGSANQIMSQNLVVAIVFSTGKNFATAPDAASATAAGRNDEAANLNGDPIFVFHPPTPAGAANGEFDDSLLWITVGELYGKLISAGMLP